MLLTLKQKEKCSQIKPHHTCGGEDEPLPSLGAFEQMVDDKDITEAGVTRVQKVSLPPEENCIETGTFDTEMTDTDREQVDKYLLEQNVITYQPQAFKNRSDNLPNHSNVSPHAPDSTQVVYQGVAFKKGAVDFFL